ncbi:YjbQ family protein [candidate division KSB1 bacterium]|nr:MAG: YjbQ family protein [candidate division KSB1 bacterium]
MEVRKEILSFKTKGECDIIDITGYLDEILSRENVESGILTVFIPGSTAAVTTIEYENGLIKDVKDLFDVIVPRGKDYFHNLTWGDGNGYSHIRAALLGPSLTVPFFNRKLTLGTWQQVVVIDFDNRPRNRKVIIQILGE